MDQTLTQVVVVLPRLVAAARYRNQPQAASPALCEGKLFPDVLDRCITAARTNGKAFALNNVTNLCICASARAVPPTKSRSPTSPHATCEALGAHCMVTLTVTLW